MEARNYACGEGVKHLHAMQQCLADAEELTGIPPAELRALRERA